MFSEWASESIRAKVLIQLVNSSFCRRTKFVHSTIENICLENRKPTKGQF